MTTNMNWIFKSAVVMWVGLAQMNLTAEGAPVNLTKAREKRDIIGVSHVVGRYCLTKKNFLAEGADEILALGSRVIKVWFYPNPQEPPRVMYPFHSQWPDVKSLVEGAKISYYRELFEKPFTTYMLSVGSMGRAADYWRTEITAEQEADETRQFYELTKHFLTTYRDTGKTFIFQHWEGDWMVRGHTDAKRDPEPKALENMVRWLNARQAGVTKARQEVGEQGVKVYHAAEVNRVYSSMVEGRPNMINSVIPKTHVDMVSYSAWDSMMDHRDDPQGFRKALDFIAKHTPNHPVLGDKNVYVGEFGIPETDYSLDLVQKVVADTVQTSLDWGCQYVVYWQLYCNEMKDPKTPVPVKNNKDMRGFWLIRPDGSKSPVWAYLHNVMEGN